MYTSTLYSPGPVKNPLARPQSTAEWKMSSADFGRAGLWVNSFGCYSFPLLANIVMKHTNNKKYFRFTLPTHPSTIKTNLELEARLFLMQLLADNDPKIGESAGQPPRPPEGDLRRENCRKDGGRPQCHEGQVGSRLGRLSRVAGKFWAGGFKERMERGL